MAKTAFIHFNNIDDSPTIYHKLMTKATATHSINTRLATRGDLILPKFNKNYKKHSFHYSIAKIWNSLPYPIKLKDTKSSFIEAMKRFLRENPNY